MGDNVGGSLHGKKKNPRAIGVVIAGLGMMGKLIVDAINKTDGLELVGCLEEVSAYAGRKLADFVPGSPEGVTITTAIEHALTEEADAVVIFVNKPLAAAAIAKYAISRGINPIIGTTGFSDQLADEISEIARINLATILASNFSQGASASFDLVKRAAKLLGPEYVVEIVEEHHDQKVDAPSGTAVSLAKVICEVRGWDPDKVIIFGRSGRTGKRPQKEICIHAVRGGDTVGVHRVIFVGNGETVEILHRAHSKLCFVSGVIRAIPWIVKQLPGCYEMGHCTGVIPMPETEFVYTNT